MPELTHLPAAELAGLIREGRCSAREALRAHLDVVERHNPRLNAVVTLDAEAATRRAAEADDAQARGESWGPLHGVPLTIKDAYETRGLRTTFGAPPLSKYVPTRDATAVARLRDAGAIVFGKTNVPLLCYDWQCVHPKFGRANNPWDPERTPGGSSGGAAAALAAGMTPLELGSDVAGSIRVPCHFCGVVGLRPTEGSVSTAGASAAPGYPRALRSFFACGPMARTVGDVELALALVRGADPREWTVAPVAPDGGKPRIDLAGSRIAFATGIGGVPVSGDTRGAVEDLAARLGDAGCRVEPALPPAYDFEEALDTWGRIQGFELASLLPLALRWPPLRWTLRLGLVQARFGRGGFSRGLARGLTLSARGYFEALTRRDALVAAMDAFLGEWDAWICPVSPTPAFTHRRTGKPLQVDGETVSYSLAMGMYACATALAANPIVALPAAQSRDGLPIAVQLHGRRWSDDRLLAIARRIEALGEPRRPPGY